MSETPVRLTWKHRLLLIGFGLFLVVLLELGLRLAGYGGRVPLLNPLPLRQGTGRLFEVHPKAAQIFFARSGPGGMSLVGSHRRDLVVLPKPPDVVRVVFVGASTVEGFPMPRNLTGARFLEEMLREALPGRRVEVVNLGVAAVASFPIRKLAVEALETMSPDLLLVYEAHNEFYGASGMASFQSMGRSVAAMQAVYFVRQLALGQVVEDLRGALRRPASATTAEGGDRPDLIRLMAAAGEIPADGELHAAARRSLGENFRAIVREARNRGVPVVLSTVVSNERDLVPLGSSEQAGAAYADARALGTAGRLAEAANQYRRARDLDTLPWRASRDKNRLLRDLAAAEEVPLADCEAAFAAASAASGGATTWELFVDHVHPNLRGQALLAETFFQAIVRHRLLPVDPSRAAPDWRQSAARLGAHPLELYLVAHKMAALFRVPPIGRNNEAAARRFAGLVDRLRGGADPVDAEAIRLWEAGSAEAGFALPISYFGGVAALRAGEPRRAAAYLHAAVENAFPWSDERSAARLLGLIAAVRAGATPSAVRPQLITALNEARQVATLPGQPTALLARSLAGLSTLAGTAGEGDEAAERGEAARWESLARDRAAAAPPWERAFLRELPDPAGLAP